MCPYLREFVSYIGITLMTSNPEMVFFLGCDKDLRQCLAKVGLRSHTLFFFVLEWYLVLFNYMLKGWWRYRSFFTEKKLDILSQEGNSCHLLENVLETISKYVSVLSCAPGKSLKFIAIWNKLRLRYSYIITLLGRNTHAFNSSSCFKKWPYLNPGLQS